MVPPNDRRRGHCEIRTVPKREKETGAEKRPSPGDRIKLPSTPPLSPVPTDRKGVILLNKEEPRGDRGSEPKQETCETWSDQAETGVQFPTRVLILRLGSGVRQTPTVFAVRDLLIITCN